MIKKHKWLGEKVLTWGGEPFKIGSRFIKDDQRLEDQKGRKKYKGFVNKIQQRSE